MYHYRMGQKKDLAQVTDLTISWTEVDLTLGYENVAWTPEKLEKKLNDYFYVVELQDDIVGYAFGEIRQGTCAQ